MICSEAAASGVKLFDHDGIGHQLQHLQATVSAQVICVQVARGVIGAVVTGHYPLNHHPARLAMEHLEQFAFGWRRISRAFSAAQSVAFVISTIAVAVVVRACMTRLLGRSRKLAGREAVLRLPRPCTWRWLRLLAV